MPGDHEGSWPQVEALFGQAMARVGEVSVALRDVSGEARKSADASLRNETKLDHLIHQAEQARQEAADNRKEVAASLSGLGTRVTAVERRQAEADGAQALTRWLVPIAVTVGINVALRVLHL